MLYKICRLCPSSSRWTHPTIKVGENKKAQTSTLGFGFEEWLNREDWLLSGYSGLDGEWRYVHIQGMLTINNAYKGQETSILFYVKEPDVGKDKTYAVAYLEKAHVIDEKEATWAARNFEKKGWLNLMRAEVEALGGTMKDLPIIPKNENKVKRDMLTYANIRFRPDSLKFFDKPKKISISAFYYGKALEWDGELPTQNYFISAVNVPSTSQKSGQSLDKVLGRFSEEILYRRATAGKLFLPRQAPIQNALAVQLNAYYKPKGYIVTCEDERVDIKIELPNKSVTFIEIKPASSAREAIRLSIGQLLEYSHYPKSKKASKLIIVSDAKPETCDLDYLEYLRNIYALPIDYVYWPRGAKSISVNELKQFV